jgi:hypothetical protein
MDDLQGLLSRLQGPVWTSSASKTVHSSAQPELGLRLHFMVKPTYNFSTVEDIRAIFRVQNHPALAEGLSVVLILT